MTLILTITIFLTSTLSGAIGMGGGMILMLLLGWVATSVGGAIALHGIIQAASNGFRTLLLLSFVRWKFVGLYLLGAMLITSLMSGFEWEAPWRFSLLGVGILILLLVDVRRFVPAAWGNLGGLWGGFLAGFILTAVSLVIGVSGPLLDLWVEKASMGKEESVATKAATQVVSHLAKVYVYWELVPRMGVDWIWLGMAVVVGTFLGVRILRGMSVARFRKVVRAAMLVAALGLVLRGI